VKIVKHLSSSLVDLMYVFDEPSVGLHPRDVHRLNELLQQLRDRGNTVLVVEHDPDVIKVADHIVDVGPQAGSQGGQVMYEGPFKNLLSADTLTGKYMKQSVSIKSDFRSPRGKLPIKNAKANNLQNVSVDIPKGVVTVITGVAGSGKSSLIHQTFLRQHPDSIVIDQSPVGVSSRSNPGTYTGIMDEVRKAFAAANKVSPSLFSFNSEGACENCQGLGVIYTEIPAMGEVKSLHVGPLVILGQRTDAPAGRTGHTRSLDLLCAALPYLNTLWKTGPLAVEEPPAAKPGVVPAASDATVEYFDSAAVRRAFATGKALAFVAAVAM
jgi:excinuclease UvrABC ATPase subunit